MAILAIKGHEARGSEVIGLLEMLGGKNIHSCEGFLTERFYYINNDGCINNDFYNKTFTIFTIELFLEIYPYKVGDKVTHDTYSKMAVERMYWDSNCNIVRYDIKALDKFEYTLKGFRKEHLQPYIEREEGVKVKEKATVTFECKVSGNDYEIIIPEDKELIEDNGRIVLRDKKPQYPKTYEVCCEVLGINELPYMVYTWNRNEDVEVVLQEHQTTLLMKLEEFRKLLICRDSYWKVAGNWKPDWNDNKTDKYIITNFKNEIVKDLAFKAEKNSILSFPAEEMRDAFYENFKDLIEECKELL